MKNKKNSNLLLLLLLLFFSFQMYLRIILVSLILLIFNVYAHNNNQENDDDFIDIGVRLTGDNHDTLIADLIAEEKDLLNAGHVSCKIIEIEYVFCFRIK